MTEVISIKFRGRGKAYFFDPAGVTAKPGDTLVVETSKGMELGECVKGNHAVEDSECVQPLRPVVRRATPDDLRIAELNRKREKEALGICRELIEKHKLEMKLVDVECSFEGNKILFFFTADGRVDFRELVKDLAGVFRTRIELRQIGVRDEAKMLGGLGICGRPFCCHQFLDDFQPVSTKMAKTQSMSLNPVKISGTCGRLMCCLRYEQEAYEDLLKHVPKNGAFVQTGDGYGNVTLVNLLRQNVKVRLDGPGEAQIRTYDADEIAEIPGGRPPEGQPLPDLLKDRPKKVREEAAEPESSRWIMPSMIVEDVRSEPSGAPQNAEKGAGEKKNSRSRRRKRGGAPNGEKRPEKVEKSERTEKKANPDKKPNQDKKPERAEKKGERSENRAARRGEKAGEKSAAPSAAPQGAEKTGSAQNRRSRSRHRKPRPKPDGEAPKA